MMIGRKRALWIIFFIAVNFKAFSSIITNKKAPKFKVENTTAFIGHSRSIFEPSIKFESFGPSNYNNNRTNIGKNNYFTKDRDPRSKRGVLDLYNMVSCATGCNPLSYKGYGCFCGFLGSGYPVDGIDRCCKIHDWCYDAAEAECPKLLVYIVPYYWQCYYGKPFCAIDHGELGGRNSCSNKLCECDRRLSECLRQFPCPGDRPLCKSSPFRLIQNILMIYP